MTRRVPPAACAALLASTLFGVACRQSPSPPTTPTKSSLAPVAKPELTDRSAAPAFEKEMLRRVNEARRAGRRCGGEDYAPAPPLVWNDRLEKAARRHVEDMAGRDRLAHEGSDGSSPSRRVEAAGYVWSRVGENIAYLSGSTEDAVTGWLASSGHCANLMNGEFREMGAAVDGVYWAQVFATPR